MRLRSLFAAGSLLLLSPLPLFAADDDAPQDCKAFIDAQWQSLGQGSFASCLKGLEQFVSSYNAQGFKFGIWGDELLSADRYYYYRSSDSGKNWEAVGLKSDLTKTTDAAPALPGPRAQAVLLAVKQDSASSTAASSTSASTAAAPATTAVSMASAAAPRSSQQDGQDRRSCSVNVGDDWKVVPRLTLLECAVALDKSPDSYDKNGFKYAYWSGVFLAADAAEVLSSADSDRWQPVLQR